MRPHVFFLFEVRVQNGRSLVNRVLRYANGHSDMEYASSYVIERCLPRDSFVWDGCEQNALLILVVRTAEVVVRIDPHAEA